MVFTTPQISSKVFHEPVENRRLPGFGALALSAGRRHASLQCETEESDKFMWVFTSWVVAKKANAHSSTFGFSRPTCRNEKPKEPFLPTHGQNELNLKTIKKN